MPVDIHRILKVSAVQGSIGDEQFERIAKLFPVQPVFIAQLDI